MVQSVIQIKVVDSGKRQLGQKHVLNLQSEGEGGINNKNFPFKNLQNIFSWCLQ